MQILRNGKMLFSMPGANALAVDRGYILAAGSEEEILNLATAETPQIDLNGLSVLPGLTDAHIHLELYGESLQIVNCDTPTRAACIERVRQKAIPTPGSTWIKGYGWNQNHWSEGYGTALELDQVSGNHPVFLSDVSLHSAWVNSLALHIAGISASTPDPEGGRIQRDAGNNPTGILFDRPLFRYHFFCCNQGILKSRCLVARNHNIWYASFFDMCQEPLVHLVTDVLAIALAILNERDFIARDNIQVCFVLRGNEFHFFADASHISTLP